ncbi:oxidoreductase [Rhodococcus sp. WMMA185]|uniref:FAD/NAD(P)-binding protein n=1 Tax=Rhodococcus sp. WMMA185 TaxID=679318 RepID=UPI00087860EA|nr:FAD/NAD(P)-binding protein [Rhodococcus sp. WMMA185]AOW94614.1 oxidoreductase [Rhodococcus sp. WMMA185]
MQNDRATPTGYRVVSRVAETHDTATLILEPTTTVPEQRVAPGQFMMLYAHGVGEIAVSISGHPEGIHSGLSHTVRSVGAVSKAIHDASVGTILGVRGPFGHGWNLDVDRGADLLIVAGGLGLAPLRPVVVAALASRQRFRRVTLIVGARDPSNILYRGELAAWQVSDAIAVEVTIDQPVSRWTGPVGFVTESLHRVAIDPACTTALLCGPEPMMRFSASSLIDRGVGAENIQVSLERNMQCGTGTCGHCQLGELLLCRDGPVVDYATAQPLLRVPEL